MICDKKFNSKGNKVTYIIDFIIYNKKKWNLNNEVYLAKKIKGSE